MFLSIVNNKMCHYLKPRALPLIFSACPEGWNDYDGNQCLHLTEKKDKRVNTFFLHLVYLEYKTQTDYLLL